MLAESAPAPFSRPGWLFELKYDGWRVLAGRESGRVVLRSRRGLDLAPAFPEVAEALAALPFDAVLDGEVVVADRQGVPRFQLLQQRGLLSDAGGVARAAVELPATFHAFDLPGLDGLDLRPLPLLARKAALARLLGTDGVVRRVEHVLDDGLRLHAQAVATGLEGTMAKRADSAYRGGRGPAWLKVRIDRTGDFVVVGLYPSRSQRLGYGSLLIAVADAGGFVYAGRVGSGLGERTLAELEASLGALRLSAPPCAGPVPRLRGSLWVEPRLVCEVRFREWTHDGVLRQPVFLRFRDDKRPDECAREPRPASPAPPSVSHPKAPAPARAPGRLRSGLLGECRAVAPWLLPWLAGRPVVTGQPGAEAEAVCGELETLLELARAGALPLRIGASRIDSAGHPDWATLALEPAGATLHDVVRVALQLREIGEVIGLPTFVKSSGAAGLHVLLPLGRQLPEAQARAFAELLARVLAEELPELATIAPAAAANRVAIDFEANGAGRAIVSALSPMALADGPVSTPLAWREVGPRLDPARFTMKAVIARLERQGDPAVALLDVVPDLAAALTALDRRRRR